MTATPQKEVNIEVLSQEQQKGMNIASFRRDRCSICSTMFNFVFRNVIVSTEKFKMFNALGCASGKKEAREGSTSEDLRRLVRAMNCDGFMQGQLTATVSTKLCRLEVQAAKAAIKYAARDSQEWAGHTVLLVIVVPHLLGHRGRYVCWRGIGFELAPDVE
eukprot:1050600-Amphidinium_carterae.1